MNHKFRVNPSIYKAIDAGERYFVLMPASSGIQKGDGLSLHEADFRLHAASGLVIEAVVTHVSAEKQLDNLVVGFLPVDDVLETELKSQQ